MQVGFFWFLIFRVVCVLISYWLGFFLLMLSRVRFRWICELICIGWMKCIVLRLQLIVIFSFLGSISRFFISFGISDRDRKLWVMVLLKGVFVVFFGLMWMNWWLLVYLVNWLICFWLMVSYLEWLRFLLIQFLSVVMGMNGISFLGGWLLFLWCRKISMCW